LEPLVIEPEDICAILLTRGDVDMDAIIGSMPYGEVIVWDNATRPFDAKVYGRYLAIAETDKPVIYFQDDDCIVKDWSHKELMAEYRPGTIIANMVEGHRDGEPPMLGWGSLFDRFLPFSAFAKWHEAGYPFDWRIARYPETIFTALTPWKKLIHGTHQTPAEKAYVGLPHEGAANRSHMQADHYGNFAQVLDEALKVARDYEATAEPTAKLTAQEDYSDELTERLRRAGQL
jgi:hypothetical protein